MRTRKSATPHFWEVGSSPLDLGKIPIPSRKVYIVLWFNPYYGSTTSGGRWEIRKVFDMKEKAENFCRGKKHSNTYEVFEVEQLSNFSHHEKCPSCGSRDNISVYENEWGTYRGCESCGFEEKEFNKQLNSKKEVQSKELDGLGTEFTDLKERGISGRIAKKYGVYLSEKGYVYPFYSRDGKQHISNKIRKRETKDFFSQGLIKEAGLFGQQLFPPGSGKYITVTEGEDDAMAASEMMGGDYPYVSIKNGANAAVRDCTDNYEYLNSFENIVLCFDKDEPHVRPDGTVHYPGQEAAIQVANLFALGKVKIVTLKLFKDARDYLCNGKGKDFFREWWQAPVYTPSGLRLGRDMWDEVLTLDEFSSIPYPWNVLNKQTYGIRLSELLLITANPGVGKSSILKEIAFPLVTEHKKKCGILFFEETNKKTTLGLMSIGCNKPLHLPDVRSGVTNDELRNIFDDTVGNDRVVLWDHFGSNSIHEVLAKIRHMAALGCKYIFLDHLSIIVSDQSGDERKQLDEISTKLRTLLQELNIFVAAVIHLSRSGEIRGSMGPEQLADLVIKAYRNKDHLDSWIRNVTKLTIEKNRFTGDTGPSSYLFYDRETGRLIELNEEQILRYENEKEK